MKYVIGLIAAFLAFTPPPARAAGWRFDGRAPDGTAAGWRVDGRTPAPLSTATDPYDGDTNAIALLMAKTGGTYTASSGGRWQFSSDDGILRVDQAGLFAQAGDGASLYMDPVNHKLVYAGQTLEVQDALVAAGDITADTFHGSAAGLTGLPTFDYTNRFDRWGATGAVLSTAADASKFLRGDGTWQEVEGAGSSWPAGWGLFADGAGGIQLTNATYPYMNLWLGAQYYPAILQSDSHSLTLGGDGSPIIIDGVTADFAAGTDGQVWTYTTAAGWHAADVPAGGAGGADAAALHFRGDWVDVATYATNDVIVWHGTNYIAVQDPYPYYDPDGYPAIWRVLGAMTNTGGSFDPSAIAGTLDWPDGGTSYQLRIGHDSGRSFVEMPKMGDGHWGMHLYDDMSGSKVTISGPDGLSAPNVELASGTVTLRGFLSLYGNGTWVDDGSGHQGYGATEDVTISGVTLHFINGIYVGHTGP